MASSHAPWLTATHLGLVSLSLVVVIASFVILIRSARARKAIKEEKPLYSDADGIATKESQSAYSNRVKRLLLLQACLNISGLGLSVAYGVFGTGEDARQARSIFSRTLASWSPVVSWICICFCTLLIAGTKEPRRRSQAACLAMVCCTCVACSLIVEHTPLLGVVERQYSRRIRIAKILAVTDCAVAFSSIIALASVPRSPQVYFNGRTVDEVNSVPWLSRMTYGWMQSFLDHAWNVKQVEVSDLKALDHWTRATDLYTSFQSLGTKGSLLKLLILAHLPALGAQYVFTIVHACLLILPQSIMFLLLRTLEAKDEGVDVQYWPWFWTISMGLAIVFVGTLNSGMWFVNYCRIELPWRIQLAAVIFAKSTRKKDVKTSTAKREDDSGDESPDEPLLPSDSQGGADNPLKAENPLQEMRQGVVNLIGIDTERVADCAFMNSAFVGSLVEIIVSFTILTRLLGWQALLAGLSVEAFFIPLNIYFSKRYAKAQDRLMKARDGKLAVINEALNGIRQIKFSALEGRWQKKIQAVREEELAAQWQVYSCDVVLLLCWFLGPVLLSATCIAVYATLHGDLPPSTAFTTLAILQEIEATLAHIPELITDVLDAWISLKRITEYLSTPERGTVTKPGDSVRFIDATIAWSSDGPVQEDAFKLSKVDLAFPNGELSVISGRTGSGKSLLLAAILGEAEVLEGTLLVPEAPALQDRFDSKANKANWIIPSAIAFVSQQPWIENRSLRDNITFDLPFDQERYRGVLSACALEKDIEVLSDGDLSEIGANGINLSGGQRWRVTLARALYSRAGILVMDDIFSAVDSHVGRHIFEHALTGPLATGRTRILVTHHVALCLPATKYEVQIGEGKIEHAGTVDSLRTKNILEDIIEQANEQAVEDTEAIEEVSDLNVSDQSKAIGATGLKKQSSNTSALDRSDPLVKARTRSMSRRLSASDHPIEASNDSKITPRKFVEEEQRETGRIKWRVYRKYLQSCGGLPYWILVVFIFIGFQIFVLLQSWVLRLWTAGSAVDESRIWIASNFTKQQYSKDLLLPTENKPPLETRAMNKDLKFYLSLYVGLAIVLCVQGTLRWLIVFSGAIKASRKLFDDITFTVLRAPLRWLDTVPVGRVLNRFTADFNQVDSELGYAFCWIVSLALDVIGVVVAAIIVSPYIILCAVMLMGVCAYYAALFLNGARASKRLDSVARSPIFDFFTTTLQGVTTIRAFGKTQSYVDQMFKKIDTHSEALWYKWTCNRWFGWRLTVIGAVFTVVTASLIITLPGIDAALGGFALAFALNYTTSILYLLREYADIEMGMNSTERIIEYGEIATEDLDGESPPAAWPTEGRLEVTDLVVGYAPDLPPVLKGLTFSVNRHERIGVVGRTGAGKSSLTLALFRFLEAREGSIFIDGIDISKIKLYDLRSRLSIIAQDPVLFSGTVRSNLDPFDEWSNSELRDALQRVQLIPESSASSIVGATIETEETGSGVHTPSNLNPFSSLSSTVSEGGLNLSQGQRQLLCLARAIVSRPKIMVLDEATSAVDKATDQLIQRSIRKEFSNSSLIVIAHRLSTIADFDRILVMSDGKAAEFGTPQELLSKEGGMFRAMVEDSGERDVLEEMILRNAGEDS